MPDAHKFVEADGKIYFACANSVDVQQTNNGYSVRLTARDWNDARTAYTDTEVYLQAKIVTVRPMDKDEISVCQTGHATSMWEAPKSPCQQWREAHPNDTNACVDK